METEPTPAQALLIWRVLAAEKPNGHVSWSDLPKGPLAKDRKELEVNGFLEVEKVGRRLHLTVSDAGWAWANDHLGDELPRGLRADGQLLSQWLRLLKTILERKKLTIADLFSAPKRSKSKPESKPTPKPRPKSKSKSKSKSKPKPKRAAKKKAKPKDKTIRARVRASYLATTGGQLNARCLLRDLRAQIDDVSRPKLDAAIKSMVKAGEAVLLRLDNRLEITDADIEAAIVSGGEPHHILWIDR